tara:strand:+ start:733 stop:2241 length:1509 start_codon:yes stop_codon:yes gene_type:complete
MLAFGRRLLHDYDARFLAFLACAYMGLKGGAGGMLRLALLPLFKTVAGATNVEYQSYALIILIPWALKPIVGMADFFPLCGRTKQWYVLAAAAVGVPAAVVLAHKYDTLPLPALAGLATAVSVQLATTDILSEGRYVTLMRGTPSDSSIVSYVWFMTMLSEIMVALVAGPVADDGNVQLLLWTVAVLCAQIVVPTAAGWMLDPVVRTQAGVPSAQRWTVHMTVLMIVASVSVAAAATSPSWQVQLAVSGVATSLVAGAALHLMPPELSRASVFMFLSSATATQFAGTLDYFYTADILCVPGGPAFSMTFYLTVATISSAVCATGGVLLFQQYFSQWRCGPLFRLTILLRVAVSFVDIAIVSRWNTAVGLADHSAYLFGDACLGSVVNMLGTMAMVVLTARVCPQQSECIVYAIVAGMQNLGASVAALNGNAATLLTGITFADGVCAFDHFPAVLAVGTMAVPVVMLPFTWWWFPSTGRTAEYVAFTIEHDACESGSEDDVTE